MGRKTVKIFSATGGTGLGEKIDFLIWSNLKNWEGKERYFDQHTSVKEANNGMIDAFQANKTRNLMITEINKAVHKGPKFHFRNYHNY